MTIDRMDLGAIADDGLLALAAKKASRFLNRHQWYHDRADAAAYMASLPFRIQQLRRSLSQATYQPKNKTLLLAPKRIVSSETGLEYVYRPLCTQSFEDEVVQVAFMSLFVDQFEDRWGDPENDSWPRLWSYGNRIHRVGPKRGKRFSLGSARLYRDWPDDYSKFVRETERSFNQTLLGLSKSGRAVLISTDIESFYPSIQRDRLTTLISNRCLPPMQRLASRILAEVSIDNHRYAPRERALLREGGLPQGPAHCGFWANVYLEEFDAFVRQSLAKQLSASGLGCRLAYFGRYVDDMRFVFEVPNADANQFVEATLATISTEAAKYNLRFGSKKTITIIQDHAGQLLSTGDTAERMQAIARQAYFPLPPTDLRDLARQIQFLFNAEEMVPNRQRRDGEPAILDNPGVRPDSRRRFAANKWVRIAREIEGMDTEFRSERARFAAELLRVWLEDPGQMQLLQKGLQLGLSPSGMASLFARLQQLKGTPESRGYYEYATSYLFDHSTIAPVDDALNASLEIAAREVSRSTNGSNILYSKAAIFLVARGKTAPFQVTNRRRHLSRTVASVLRVVDNPAVLPTIADATAQIALLLQLRIEKRVLHKHLRALLENRSLHYQRTLARELLSRSPEVGRSICVALAIDLPELSALSPPPDVGESGPLWKLIAAGTFRHPIAWMKLAQALAKIVRRKTATRLGAVGQLNPFAMSYSGGQVVVRANGPRLTAYKGHRQLTPESILASNNKPWCYPVGLILRAAASGRVEDLLGVPPEKRWGLAGAFGWATKHRAKIPLAACEIVDRLTAWHGSQIAGFTSADELLTKVQALAGHIRAATSKVGGVVLCDVIRPVQPQVDKRGGFPILLCQAPSYPDNLTEASIRRALSIARVMVEQQRNESSEVGLVVFPELSVPEACVPLLMRFARQTRALVLAGLEPRIAVGEPRTLNELIWIVPADDEARRLYVLHQEKIHITPAESEEIKPPIVAASPPVIWRIIDSQGRIAAINCFEFTDLELRDLLRGRIEALVVAANNHDVTTFDNLVESTHFDLHSHVILVNAQSYGGSAVRAPYYDARDRRIFDIHGNRLFAVNLCNLDLAAFRAAIPRKKIKSRPAGFIVHE